MIRYVDHRDLARCTTALAVRTGVIYAGSTQPLSGASTGPAQVYFSPDGRVRVVTEKATNLIGTYVVESRRIRFWIALRDGVP